MARRGEVEDFVWVLAIALILIIVVGIFSFFVPYTGPLTNITISTFSPGLVGYVKDYVGRSTDLKTFTVGETQAESIKSWPQMEISQGYFGGKVEKASINIPDYLMETARGVRISFLVFNTNNYGNLVIKWNGREIVNQAVPKGHKEIFINKADVRGSNSIEVYSTGPGLFFWASSVYIMKNFNVNVEYGPSRIIPFVMLSSELERFDRVEIASYASGTGTLEIKINGVDVFSGQPQGLFREDFTLFEAPVRPGQNILTLSDKTGTYTLRDTVFKVFLTGDQSVSSHRFNITEEHFNFLANSIFQGKVDYFIDNIAKPGGVEITINGRHLGTPAPRVGLNSASFTANVVSVGENTISFTGTGSFNIPEASIGLER